MNLILDIVLRGEYDKTSQSNPIHAYPSFPPTFLIFSIHALPLMIHHPLTDLLLC